MKGQLYSSEAEAKHAVHTWMRSKPQIFFMDRIKTGIVCSEKCVAQNGAIMKNKVLIFKRYTVFILQHFHYLVLLENLFYKIGDFAYQSTPI